MRISGVSNNSYVNNYYQNKTDKVARETAPEDVQQEQTTEKAESEAATPIISQCYYDKWLSSQCRPNRRNC